MRFEISYALKYLLPRKKSISTSIISLISIVVISLVVWLVLVFLSVTEGIEKRWLEELTATTAPLQIKPTEAYYHSYYHLIDTHASESNFHQKSLSEKLTSDKSDPYDPMVDAELPSHFPLPDKTKEGEVKDLVKELSQSVKSVSHFKGFRITPTEIALSNLHIDLTHEAKTKERSFITQLAYITAFDNQNTKLKKLILSPKKSDGEALAPFTSNSVDLPSDPQLGFGILLSKAYQKSGVEIGDKGYLAFYAPGGLKVDEMRQPIYVAGFYDPGLVPLGNRLILADKAVVSLLKSEFTSSDALLGDGFQLWFDNVNDAIPAKKRLIAELKKRDLDNYFQVMTFTDYEFTKPIFDQLKSDKTLFTLIALIIMLVACSNIISMLILMVSDKRKEIAIMQALGLSRLRIALLFGTTGLFTGLVSSTIGIFAAIFTLKHLDSLVSFLSLLSGHEAFQEVFFGAHLPNELSSTYLCFVFLATLLLSTAAALVPAIKAARIQPTEIFKRE